MPNLWTKYNDCYLSCTTMTTAFTNLERDRAAQTKSFTSEILTIHKFKLINVNFTDATRFYRCRTIHKIDVDQRFVQGFLRTRMCDLKKSLQSTSVVWVLGFLGIFFTLLGPGCRQTESQFNCRVLLWAETAAGRPGGRPAASAAAAAPTPPSCAATTAPTAAAMNSR